MNAPQIIRTPSGEELVVLSRAEYEALLYRADHAAEDADDVAIYDARKSELAAGIVILFHCFDGGGRWPEWGGTLQTESSQACFNVAPQPG